MEERPRKKVSPIWHSDIPGMLSLFLGPVVIGILASQILPALNHIRRADAWGVFGAGLATGAVGVALLFFSRLPLYRAGKFFAFGSRSLDMPHRWLYRLAYCFVAVSLFLLLNLYARLH